LIAGGVAAINYASDLDETKNKVNVVFGSMSADVLAWSENSATALGQSQEQALAAAATYGNLFVAMGLGQGPAADMSTSLVGLASDLASFNNANPQDVLNALRSGLSGEIEPLKKYGVAMNEAILKQQAMEMGLGDNIQALTEAEKLQVRYAIIMKQTTVAQGDFARTADGLANSQRILKAQFIDAAAALGTQLLPYALQFVTWVSGLITKFQQLTPEQQKWVVIIGVVVAAIGPLLVVVGSLVTAIGAIIGVIGAITTPILIVIAVIAALIAVGYLLYQAWTNNWGGIQEKTAEVWAGIQAKIATGMEFIQAVIAAAMTVIEPLMRARQAAMAGDWYAFGENLRKAWDAAWKLIGQIVSKAWTNLKSSVSALINNVINTFKTTDWGEVGRNIVSGIANGITSAIDWAIAAIMGLGKAVLDAIKGFLMITSPSKLLALEVGMPMGQGIGVGMEDSIAALKRRMPKLLGELVMQPTTSGAAGGESFMLNNYGRISTRDVTRLRGKDLQKMQRLT
jgi:hypothetical protein